MTIKIRKDEGSFNNTKGVPREISVPKSSTEVYYGNASVAVPFQWESQPGMPKVKFRETPLPPLTPPPSYLFCAPKIAPKKNSNPKSIRLSSVFPKLSPTRKSQSPSSPVSSPLSFTSLSRSSSPLVPSSPYPPHLHEKGRHLNLRSSLESRMRMEDDFCESPVSTLCFGIAIGAGERPRGYSLGLIKVLQGKFA